MNAMTVYITGASAGLGKAIARAFSYSGASVGLIARDEGSLKKAADEMPGEAAFAAADVGDYRSLEQAAESLEKRIGPPDVWINDAVATVFSRFGDITPEEFARVTEVTYLGSIYGIRQAIKMMKGRGGQIIQIGSSASYLPVPLQAPYCGAKSALRGAVDALRCELHHDGIDDIKLTHVHMPSINTPQFDWARRHIAYQQMPLPPVYSPDTCAKAVLWASRHPDRRDVWVGGPAIAATVLRNLFPSLVDCFIARKAYSGQFGEISDQQQKEGNLFAPAESAHHTHGRFTRKERREVLWTSTSAGREAVNLAILAGIVLVLLILI